MQDKDIDEDGVENETRVQTGAQKAANSPAKTHQPINVVPGRKFAKNPERMSTPLKAVKNPTSQSSLRKKKKRHERTSAFAFVRPRPSASELKQAPQKSTCSEKYSDQPLRPFRQFLRSQTDGCGRADGRGRTRTDGHRRPRRGGADP